MEAELENLKRMLQTKAEELASRQEFMNEPPPGEFRFDAEELRERFDYLFEAVKQMQQRARIGNPPSQEEVNYLRQEVATLLAQSGAYMMAIKAEIRYLDQEAGGYSDSKRICLRCELPMHDNTST